MCDICKISNDMEYNLNFHNNFGKEINVCVGCYENSNKFMCQFCERDFDPFDDVNIVYLLVITKIFHKNCIDNIKKFIKDNNEFLDLK